MLPVRKRGKQEMARLTPCPRLVFWALPILAPCFHLVVQKRKFLSAVDAGGSPATLVPLIPGTPPVVLSHAERRRKHSRKSFHGSSGSLMGSTATFHGSSGSFRGSYESCPHIRLTHSRGLSTNVVFCGSP